MVPNDGLELAAGTRLVHIGPYKTGTTALQGALHRGRKQLAEQGVVVVGKSRQPMTAALAITQRKGLIGAQPADPSHWQQLLDEADEAGDNYFVASSEFFSDGDAEAAQRVVDDLGGGPKVQVVVTLRPLSKILPSQWQQYVQNGMRMSYEKWLDGMLVHAPYDDPTPSFWRRHRHDRLIERWANAVGPENLTVLVVDDSDRRMILDTFEAFLGLPEGTLVPDSFQNRSLALGEVEFVRLINQRFKSEGWPDEWYANFMRQGALRRLQKKHIPLPEEPKIVTPHWALEQAAEINAEMADKIEKVGVRVLGDMSILSKIPPPPPAETEPPKPMLSSAAAAHLLLGAVNRCPEEDRVASPTGESTSGHKEKPQVEDRTVGEVGAVDLARVLVNRGTSPARKLLRLR